MADILIRDVEPDVHEELKARARAAGQTLQAYLKDLLVAEARNVDPAHWYANLHGRRVGARPVADVVAALDAARRERDDQLPAR